MVIADSFIPNHEKTFKNLLREISCKILVMHFSMTKIECFLRAHIILKNKYVMLNLYTHVQNSDLHLGSNINGKNIS
jgi:hypothetical protein